MVKCRVTGFMFVILVSIAHANRLPPMFKRMKYDRYRPRVSFIHTPLRLQDKNQYFTYYENYPLRKHFSDVTPLLPPKPERQTDPFRDLFDENGMIFLTLPKNNDDRLLNKLMNDIIIINSDKNERVLRNNELINDKKMLRGINILRTAGLSSEKHNDVVPNNAFDFYDVVG